MTKPELIRACQSVLGLAPTEPPPAHWDEPIEAALRSSKQTVISALVARGFTLAQVEAWDRQREFHRDLAICHAFRDEGIARDYSATHLDKKCEKVAELAEVTVTEDGVPVVPDEETTGRVSHGTYDEDDDDIFTLDFEA
jgi:hypothetical protein